MDLYFDVIPKDKVQDLPQKTYDWMGIPAQVIPTSFNEKHNLDVIPQTDIENETVPENTMDVDPFNICTTVTDTSL